MPEISVQEIESNLPILFLYSNSFTLLPEILAMFSKNMRIIVVSDQEIDTSLNPKIFHLKSDTSYLVGKLEDHIDYALLFIDDIKDEKILEYLASKLASDNTKTTIIIPIEKVSQFYDLLSSLLQRKNIDVLLLGDIFDLQSGNLQNETSKIIRNAIAKKIIILTGNDLSPIFPLSLTDFFTGLQSTLFGQNGKGNLFYFFYSHPQTVISAAHLLNRIEPDLQLQFGEGLKREDRQALDSLEPDIVQHFGKKPSYLDSYFLGFEKSISRALEISPIDDTVEESTSKLATIKRAVPHPKKKNLKVYLSGILIYVLLNFLFVTMGYYSLTKAESQMQKGDYLSAEHSMEFAATTFGYSLPFINTASQLAAPLNTFLGIGRARAKLTQIENVLITIKELIELKQSISFTHPPNSKTLGSFFANLIYLYFQTNELPPQLGTRVSKLLSSYTPLLNLAEVIPSVLGYQKEQTYLLLFENNAELRPTGGFIGSVGELTLLHGKVENLQIQDVYNVDGQLKEHIEPYFIVRRYLQPNLYLRDSNFDPDFQHTASTSALIYKLETGKKVDGVIALDFDVLSRIIGKIGPLPLPDYNTTLTKNNAQKFIQDTIEKNFFPGSTQKKDILSSVMNQVLLKVEHSQDAQLSLLSILPQLLEQKHIQFAFRDSATQRIFTLMDFGGTFLDTRDKTPGNVYDTLAINEANIGVNKANTYVTRNITDDVTITHNSETSRITLELGNTNGSMTYRTYVRFFMPQGAELTGIAIDGKAQLIVPAVTNYRIYEAKNFVPPKGLEVDTSYTDGLIGSGFITSVPPKTIQKIEVTYIRPLPALSSLLTYSLLYSKQPGTEPYPFQLMLHFPQTLKAQNTGMDVVNGQTAIITKEVTGDENFAIPLTPANQ